MLILLSPAKTIDVDRTPSVATDRQPRWLERSSELADALRPLSVTQLKALMKVSEKLAELNRGRWADWERPIPSAGSAPAVFAFRGDVYRGLDADGWTPAQIRYADEHLRILSGLHGVLRPLDRILPYRLEMGTKLSSDAVAGLDAKTLYDFWDGTIAHSLVDDLTRTKSRYVLNLASKEYSDAAKLKDVPVEVVSPTFEEVKNGKPKMVTLFAKVARGTMASWVIRNKVRTPRKLRTFAEDGYRLDDDRSTDTRPVFVRG